MKTAIITGAARGIGKSIATYLSEKGYNLLLIDMLGEVLEDTAEEIKKQFKVKVTISGIDVSDYRAVSEAVSAFLKTYNQIDILINNAGYIKRGTSELTKEEFMKMLNVNLIGAFNLINCVIPSMKERHSGYVINLASQSGKRARPFLGGYAASKFGLVAFNESLYKEMSDYNVHVTAICPGFVATDMTSDVVDIKQSEMLQKTDIVRTVDYLLSLPNNVAIKEIVLECQKQIRRPE